jgi:dipeptidyl aminopeptidase/acylaminoacyl peptidase
MPLAAQLLSAVDAAVATGRVDGNRLGLWGHSFGGFTAATIATQTHRFRAIVASSGTYDLTSFRGQFAPASRVAPDHGTSIMTLAGWSESGQAALHASPWQDPMRYVVNSPITYADRIQTPMLLVGGDIDTTWIGQAEELFSALARQGKDAELLTYWGGEHVLVSPADVRDLYARVFAWFDMHFKDPGLTAPTARATTITPGKAMLALAPGYPPTRAPNARAAGL